MPGVQTLLATSSHVMTRVWLSLYSTHSSRAVKVTLLPPLLGDGVGEVRMVLFAGSGEGVLLVLDTGTAMRERQYAR